MACKCYHADKNFLGKIGVCWGTKEVEACSCGGDEAKCDFYDYVRERVKQPTTNADHIRSTTDEELAVLIAGFRAEGYAYTDRSEEFIKPCLEWLKNDFVEELKW